MDSITVTKWSGLALGTVLPFGFVAVMYLPHEARQNGYQRDLKENIRKRILGAAAICSVGTALLPLVKPAEGEAIPLLARCGLAEPILGLAAGIGLTASLFAGVLREKIMYNDCSPANPPEGLIVASVCPQSDVGHQYYRNYVFAPLTEEFVFRVVLVYVMQAAGWRPLITNVLGVVAFSLAHVHHLYLFRTSLGYTNGYAAFVVSANFLVHSVFGTYSLVLYRNTGSLLCTAVAHSMCNALGAPSLDFVRSSHLTTWQKVQIGIGHIGGIAAFCYGVSRVAELFPKNYIQ